jgi:hypothetical protein
MTASASMLGIRLRRAWESQALSASTRRIATLFRCEDQRQGAAERIGGHRDLGRPSSS